MTWKNNTKRQENKEKTEISDALLKDYKDAVSFVESFSNLSYRNNFGINAKDPSLFLKRTQKFLDLLGNPENDFKYVHITGTAGKGSVSSLVQEMLVQEGRVVGLFTSPYVTTTIEKIKVNDKYISANELIEIINYLKPCIKKLQATEYGEPGAFEIFLAVALIYYKKMKCEWVVLEVGLGGRYDATNVIKKPVVTAITNINYDHTEILGKTLEKIAFDKAGIIKKGCDFYTTEQRSKLLLIFKNICDDVGAKFHSIGKQKDTSSYNEVLATNIAKCIKLSEISIIKGINNNKIPCRFEIMSKDPVIVLDGAHNIAKIRSTLNKAKKLSHKKLIVILSLSNTKKDDLRIIKPLVCKADNIILSSTTKTERRSINPVALLPYVNKYKKKGTRVDLELNPFEALKLAKKYASKEDLILVTGSFFLAGELRKVWYSEEWVLKNRKSF